MTRTHGGRGAGGSDPGGQAAAALQRLAGLASKVDAGRIPNQLSAIALAVQRAVREGSTAQLDHARASLEGLVAAQEAREPGGRVTALLREALDIVEGCRAGRPLAT